MCSKGELQQKILLAEPAQFEKNVIKAKNIESTHCHGVAHCNISIRILSAIVIFIVGVFDSRYYCCE